jgi:heme exporter protein D
MRKIKKWFYFASYSFKEIFMQGDYSNFVFLSYLSAALILDVIFGVSLKKYFSVKNKLKNAKQI